MSYRIAISFAAAAIGSCFATEAIAQAPAGFAGAAAPQVEQSRAPAGFAGAAAPQMQRLKREKVEAMQQLEREAQAPAGFAGAAAPQAGSIGGAYYAPASDIGNGTACGRFPYPPCKKAGE
jgi:hypothetical protein